MGGEIRNRLYILGIWMVISIVIVSSCSGIDSPDVPIKYNYPVFVSASDQSQTKISLNGLSLSWEDSDRLQITAISSEGHSGVSQLSIYENRAKSASFSGFVSMDAAPEECYFTYPSGSVMSVDNQKRKILVRFNQQDGTHKPLLYAKSVYNPNRIEATLSHAGVMLEIDVKINGICSLSFYGNKKENIYPVYIDPFDGKYHSSEEVGVEIKVPVQSEGKTYICVPAVNLERGFTLELTNTDGAKMIRSFSDGVTGGYDLRNMRGMIVPITLDGTFEGFDISYSSLYWGHTYKDELLSGTSVSFVMNKSGFPDSRIEEWGATLLDEKGNIVRSYKSNSGADIKGSAVSLDVVGDYKLLPAGQYVFSPYYMSYGKKVTLDTRTITMPDPGVEITLGGYTSYDKYIGGNIQAANNDCANNKIYGVSVSVNVHTDIITGYSATLDGGLPDPEFNGSSAQYGDIERNSFGSYAYSAIVNVGNLTFEAKRNFHITGLPYEANFESSNPSGWKPAWAFCGTEYSDKRVTFAPNTFSNKTSAIRTPSFSFPENNSVTAIVKADVSCKDKDVKLFVTPCTKTSNTPVTEGDYIQPNNNFEWYQSIFSKGYVEAGVSLTLNNNNSNIIFSATVPVAYNLGLYKVSIQYQ